MLPGVAEPLPAASPTISEPTPSSLPSREISAAPLQAGCGGAVKIASSSRYSQLPANSRLAATRAGDTMFGPPWLAISTGSFTFTSAERPKAQRLELERLDRAQHAEAGLVVVADDRSPARCGPHW